MVEEELQDRWMMREGVLVRWVGMAIGTMVVDVGMGRT